MVIRRLAAPAAARQTRIHAEDEEIELTPADFHRVGEWSRLHLMDMDRRFCLAIHRALQ